MATRSTFRIGDVEVLVQSRRAGVEAELTARLTEFIAGTKETLDGAIYDLRDEQVLAALDAIATRRKLRLVVDARPQDVGFNGADPKPLGMQTMLPRHALARSIRKIPETGKRFMHHKFLIRDGTDLWTGSANFTPGGLELQDNNCLVIRSRELCDRYQAVFDVLWRTRANNPVPSPTKPLDVGGVPIWPLFEPGTKVEHIEVLLVPYLNHATSLRILAFEFTDPGMLGALRRFEPRTSDVKGVLDRFQFSVRLAKTIAKRPGDYWFMKDRRFVRAPSHPFRPGQEQDFMHNKVLIIDGATVITGSYNFSEHAETNAENMLVIESRGIARFYLAYFDALFTRYRRSTKR